MKVILHLDLNQGFGFDEMLQLIDVTDLICQGFYAADFPIYIHYRGLGSAFLGDVMQNGIDILAGIIQVRFSVL